MADIEVHDLKLNGDWVAVATDVRERVWSILVGLANRDEAIDPADTSFYNLASQLYRTLWDESTFFFVVKPGRSHAITWSRSTAEWLAGLNEAIHLYVVELRQTDDGWQLAINEDFTWRELEANDE